jgi:hypothetical protein
MGKPDDAEAMLEMCPSLKDFTDDTFLQTEILVSPVIRFSSPGYASIKVSLMTLCTLHLKHSHSVRICLATD